MRKPETRLVKKIRQALIERFGGFWHKNWGGGFSDEGLPDLEGCIGGLYVAIEVKQGNNTTSSLQSEILRQIRREGGIAIVGRSVKGVIDRVEKALESSKKCRLIYIKEKKEFPSDGHWHRENFINISESAKKARKRKR